MPEGFRGAVRRLDGIQRSVVIASDNTWLDRSWSEQGEVVDDPRPGFAIPLEVAAVEPEEIAPFPPPADRSAALALADGQGILGESSARLRGLGPGAVLRFGDVRIEVAAILPDELVGAHELMVSREVGGSIGVTQDRYALVVPDHARTATAVERLLDPILPADPPSKVRAPGDTPYFRQGDAVLPPVRIKLLFGEFQARPEPGNPGFLDLDPAGEAEHRHPARPPARDGHLQRVPVPQLRGVVHELIDRGLQDTIHSYSGCYSPPPQPDPERRPVAPLLGHRGRSERAAGEPVRADPAPGRSPWTCSSVGGFVWGGTFIVPDDALRVPARTRRRLARQGWRCARAASMRQSALCSVSGGRNQGPSMPPAANARGFLLLRGRPKATRPSYPRPPRRANAFERYATVERRPESRERTMSHRTIAAAALAATTPAATRVLGCAAVRTIRVRSRTGRRKFRTSQP